LVYTFLQRFPFGRAAFVFSFIARECRMLKRVFRIRAAPDKGHRGRPALVKSLKRIIFLYAFPEPPASREQGRALHDRNSAGES
jgi:hypothetical protein